ncbi:hypothetical protein A2773_04590 [Candidatus Gottesmanbacteria bacterium RIFCSPHIGHO2_01_FULL_39_10]|uniref:AB hydrolase-1 domain-containing protein n=1 Tax=Candidatus Gottesmanbacteria bacterium RIFCSPHIGHO2_01_FULL_39_10 TaxID=1798375 RepID=A0A1F5ZRN0_9BACT|nr:MAG: hypothetical protein A2773_04590 [Candidatus Gottesmanbacteria bacterium RIFCSPHIGHO2_01_FULL_39_10]
MSNYKTYKTKIDGIHLHFAKMGKGSPLVLIHGWTNNWKGWLPLVEHLKEKFTLYIVDLPGYGDSGSLARYDIIQSASYLGEFIRLLSIKPAVSGFSMGTFVATQTALDFPDLVSAVILIGPPVKEGTNFRGNKILINSLKSVDSFHMTKRLLKKLLESKRFTYAIAKYMNMYKFDKNLVDMYGMEGKKKLRIDAFLDMGISFSSTPLVQNIINLSVPALLVYGREDKVAKPSYAQLLVGDKLKLSVIPYAGHMVFWEKPQEVAESIQAFLFNRMV